MVKSKEKLLGTIERQRIKILKLRGEISIHRKIVETTCEGCTKFQNAYRVIKERKERQKISQ